MEYEYEIKISNGKTVNLDGVRCPVCGATMLVDNSHPVMPIQETWIQPMEHPFFGNIAGETTTYTSHLRCPDDCCCLEIEHEVKELIL